MITEQDALESTVTYIFRMHNILKYTEWNKTCVIKNLLCFLHCM